MCYASRVSQKVRMLAPKRAERNAALIRAAGISRDEDKRQRHLMFAMALAKSAAQDAEDKPLGKEERYQQFLEARAAQKKPSPAQKPEEPDLFEPVSREHRIYCVATALACIALAIWASSAESSWPTGVLISFAVLFAAGAVFGLRNMLTALLLLLHRIS
jgi:hypothetical protein